jgi:thiamine-monophosphate kinase
MHEYDMIRTIVAAFPRSPDQLNAPFTCDAELVRIGGQVWGVTMDDFSPEEDRFTSDDPAALGANLATATLSDLLAAGVEPRFFLHALSLPRRADAAFVERLSAGIRGVLDAAGCACCGGDLGVSNPWRYCGLAMGPVLSGRPLTHRLPADIPQVLWVSGELGDANAAAWRGLPPPRFELRLRESRLVREWGTACIDTSGGFFDALWLLHEQSPGTRFEVYLESIPIAAAARQLARRAGVPAESVLLGGAGEYELLFAAPEDLPADAERELLDAGLTPIGTAYPHERPEIDIRRHGQFVGVVSGPPPCPREAATIHEHARAVLCRAGELFGGFDA